MNFHLVRTHIPKWIGYLISMSLLDNILARRFCQFFEIVIILQTQVLIFQVVVSCWILVVMLVCCLRTAMEFGVSFLYEFGTLVSGSLKSRM